MSVRRSEISDPHTLANNHPALYAKIEQPANANGKIGLAPSFAADPLYRYLAMKA